MHIKLMDIDYIEHYENQKAESAGWWFVDQQNSKGQKVVLFACPFCQQPGTLNGDQSNHTIAPDGTVNPSVRCDCGKFHAYITLLKYKNN